ncbi:MAG: PaeR7I family type II restriction endonuclease [Thermodesulfobacteriota bacterium]
MEKVLKKIEKNLAKAVAHYWTTRETQKEKQILRGVTDSGLRSADMGGAQMDGFINLFTNLIVEAEISSEFIYHKNHLELPGYFRPTKEWDIIVVKDGHLIVAIEVKSQVGPSFGNNFNNRTEEAIGGALDLWTAFREGAFNAGLQPFLGYFFMLEDSDHLRVSENQALYNIKSAKAPMN